MFLQVTGGLTPEAASSMGAGSIGHPVGSRSLAVPMENSSVRLTVYLTEDDRSGHHALHHQLLHRAREAGMAGATVWRAIEGFGSSGRLRTARFPDAATGLPMVFEVIGDIRQIDGFVAVVQELAPDSLVTRQQVSATRFRPEGPPTSDDSGPSTTVRA